MADAIRLLVVDDHPIVRAGLRATLDVDPRVEVVGDVASGDEAIELACANTLDVVLMDLDLGPGIDGAETTRALTSLANAPRVLVLTAHESEADIRRLPPRSRAG